MAHKIIRENCQNLVIFYFDIF